MSNSQSAISNYQSSLALTEGVVAEGVFPSPDGGEGPYGDYIGMIATYAFNYLPGGLYSASGLTVPINQNTALFSVLGVNYGGNGTTNFDAPNLDGVTMIGDGDGAGLPAANIGEALGDGATTLSPAELPSQYGGTSASFSNYQPSLPITYAIAITGVYPSRDGGSEATDMIGAVDAFAGNFAPGGFLACDGQLLPISEYTALFSILGTQYGGNGTTNFALPNLEGRTIVGASASDPVGTELGTANVSLTNAEMPTPGTTPQSVDNVEPSLALNYLIALFGIFPTQDGGSQSQTTPFVGQIQAFAGDFAPAGWALCDGQLLSISANAALFDLIGTTYGGDGVTTFALPNLQGTTVIGTGGSYSIGQLIGANTTTLVAADIPTAVIVSESLNAPAGTAVAAGATIGFSLSLNENVTVTEGGAAPTLQLNDGEVATYSGPVGVGVDALNFSYTVAAGDNIADLQATAINALAAGTTIDNEAGTAADLSGFTAIDSGVEVETTSPTATFASSVVIANVNPIDDTITFSGTDDDNFGVASVSIYANGTDLGSATLNPAIAGAWSFTSTFGLGTYQDLQAVAFDRAGNQGEASAPFALTVADDVVTQNNADGSKVVSTFNIAGQAFTEKVISNAANGEIVSKLYEGITSEGNLSSFEYLYAGNNLAGTDDFYTGITSEPYTSEEMDYDGAGQIIRAAFSGVTGAPYSSYEYDYVGGVFAGSKFTYTAVPAGATYSSYEVDYNQSNAFAGEKFFFADVTGEGYTGAEIDFDANMNLSRVLLTGVQNQAYSSLELDYNDGTYAGYKAYYDVTGQSYTNEEIDVSAADVLEKVVYSGMTGTPYQTVEQDYSNGAVDDVIYGYTDVTGQTYNAYQVIDDASGAALQETFDLNSGGHTLLALSGGQTLTSLGNDKMTGSAIGATTFVLDAVYGADVIANFNSDDTISLPSSEFGDFAAVTGAASQSGSNVVITASDGDTLTLKNLTTTMLAGMSSNFAFHA